MMAEMCEHCSLPMAAHLAGDRAGCTGAQASVVVALLGNIAGAPVKCRGCEALVYWVTHKNGKRAPYTAAGLNHFIDCPAAAQFGKGRA